MFETAENVLFYILLKVEIEYDFLKQKCIPEI